MARFKALLEQEEFEQLHRDVDSARGKMVRVNKVALTHLLHDHSELWAKLGIEDD